MATTARARTGTADLPLHDGRAPAWLFQRMSSLAREVVVFMASEFGPDEILRRLGVRPTSVSKYCVGVAALHPQLPSNPWHRTLRRYFGPLTVAA
jgi:hypothetical protein